MNDLHLAYIELFGSQTVSMFDSKNFWNHYDLPDFDQQIVYSGILTTKSKRKLKNRVVALSNEGILYSWGQNDQ